MTITDVFSLICIPMLVIGLVCMVAGLTRPMGKSRNALFFTGALPFVICALGATLSPHITSRMVANQWVAIFLLGALVFSGALFLAFSSPGRKQVKERGKIVGWLVVPINMVTGPAFLALGGWYFVGDFLLDRHHVQGMLGPKHVKSGKYGIPSYYLHFNGRDHETTAEVYQNVVGQGYSRAEIGAGSNIIFKIEPVPFPQTAPALQHHNFPPTARN